MLKKADNYYKPKFRASSSDNEAELAAVEDADEENIVVDVVQLPPNRGAPGQSPNDHQMIPPNTDAPELSPSCTAQLRNTARGCILPLMDTWIAIRSLHPSHNNISFPLFKYNRNELLELCDG